MCKRNKDIIFTTYIYFFSLFQHKALSKHFGACPSTNQSASKGVPVTICCPVRGFPPPEVTWSWPDGTEQKTGSTILPITPKEKDFGTYTCKAVGLDPDPVIILINLREERLGKYIFLMLGCILKL